MIFRFEPGKFVESCVPIVPGEPLPASLSLLSTILADSNTQRVRVAVREVEDYKISVAGNISFHTARNVVVVDRGCFVIRRKN